jgi:hypothetical protein
MMIEAIDLTQQIAWQVDIRTQPTSIRTDFLRAGSIAVNGS